MLTNFYLLLIAGLSFIGNPKQTDSPPAKHEFRAVWVATFHNIDWPSAKGLKASDQQSEFLQLLRNLQRNRMNAVVVQVRSNGDAIYKSDYAPWSEYINGAQGLAPEPYYDPLRFMVSAAHDRNMEFHAWFNPFRAISHHRFSSVADSNIARKHPEWTYQYGNTRYLNPGIPEVRNYLTKVVMEVVQKYDVDGIHFDDYFYPYQTNGEGLNDVEAFERYGSEFRTIHAWRRHNVDAFIQQVSDSLKSINPRVKFGISPVGIWRNKQDDPNGSNSDARFTSYDGLYADVRKWLESGWIDYVAPQLYWATEHPRASYDALAPWWAENTFGKHLYIGHAAFKLKEKKSTHWKNPEQLPHQLQFNQSYPQIKGSIFYSASSFEGNPHQVDELLQNDRFRYPALIPSMPWKDNIPPQAPDRLMATAKPRRIRLQWEAPKLAKDGESASYYIVYRFEGAQAQDMRRADRIRTITKDQVWLDLKVESGKNYTYLVTAVDRLHNESRTCAVAMIESM